MEPWIKQPYQKKVLSRNLDFQKSKEEIAQRREESKQDNPEFEKELAKMQ